MEKRLRENSEEKGNLREISPSMKRVPSGMNRLWVFDDEMFPSSFQSSSSTGFNLERQVKRRIGDDGSRIPQFTNVKAIREREKKGNREKKEIYLFIRVIKQDLIHSFDPMSLRINR